MFIGVGLGIDGQRSRAGLPPPPVFDPLALFAQGAVGHWPEGYALAGGRVFQLSDGSLPLTAAVQPVGRATARAGGAAGVQATSLSRPTLSRVPLGGRRNLLTQSEDLTHAVWVRTAAAALADSGFTALSFAAPSTDRRQAAYQGVPEVPVGEQGFLRARFRPGAGVTRLALGVRASSGVFGWASFDTGAGTWAVYGVSSYGTLEGLSAVEVAAGVWELVVRYTAPSAGRPGSVLVHFGAGSAADLRLNSPVCACDVGLVQWARTDAPYQRVASDRDVTQAGVPDVWHLHNDGNDSLVATLPAGTYTAAWVSALGAVTIAPGVAVAGALDVLRGQDQADVLIIDRALTAGEQADLTAYWQARYLP